MAIVEVQFEQQKFFDLVKAQVVRTSLPGSFIDDLAALGALIERLECTAVFLVDDNALRQASTPPPGQERPNVGVTGPGQILLRANLKIYFTTYARAKQAGHLNPPATTEQAAQLFIRLGASATDGLTVNVVGAVFADKWQAIDIAPSQQALTSATDQLTFVKAALVARSGVVAIRLGTQANDDVLGGDPATFNRLAGHDWGQFVAGQVFAEQVGAALNDTLDKIIAKPTDPELEMLQRADGAWFLPQRLAAASANINALDAILGAINETIRIEAAATIDPKPVSPGATSYGFDLDVRVQWIADDILTDIGFDVVQDEVNEGVGKNLSDPPEGYEELERTEDHVRYRSSNYKEAPRGNAFHCRVTDTIVDDSGLVVLGTVVVLPPPSATFEFELPYWGFDGNCQTKNVRQVLVPAHLRVVGTDPRHPVHLRAEPTSEPKDTWTSDRRLSMPGATPVTLDVYFHRRRVPPTGGQSVFVYTNVGVRWMNIGILPARPPVTDRALMLRTAALISQCMAISDRWGEGVLNLDWLVDPPPPGVDYGIPPVIEWAVAVDDVYEVGSVELTAVGEDGARRRLGAAEVVDGRVVAQVVTAANETLEISTGVPMSGPAPRISRRWIVPTSSTSIGTDVAAITFDDTDVALLRTDGTTAVFDPTTSDVAERPAGLLLAQQLNRRNDLGLSANLRTRNFGGSTVAAVDRGHLVLGIAGAFEPVVQPRVG